MNSAVAILDKVIDVARHLFFAAAIVLFVIFGVDWLVRTRRLNPFGGIARFFRRTVHPLVTPVERAVVRAGGLPTTAPWWALVAVVIAGIVIIAALGYLRDQVALMSTAAQFGPRMVIDIIVTWVFGIMFLALIIRVVASWVRLSLWSPWLRWTVTITEPLMRPLRRVVPPLGMVDLTPLAAWVVLWVLEMLVHTAVGWL